MAKSKRVEAEEKVMRVPKGHFVVYVGHEMTRFVVPTYFLKSPAFQQLLQNAADEFGFDSQDRIVLPCDEFYFHQLTSTLKSRKS